MILFQDKDSEYLQFLSKPENRTGFVVNTTRKPSKGYVMLHKATCGTIQGAPTSGRTFTGDYCKVWAATAAELIAWSETELGRAPKPCGRCRPLANKLHEQKQAEEILKIAPLSEAASPPMRDAIQKALRDVGIQQARGVWITYTDMHQTWMVGLPTSDPQVFAKIWQSIMHGLQSLVKTGEALPNVALCDFRNNRLMMDFGEALFAGDSQGH